MPQNRYTYIPVSARTVDDIRSEGIAEVASITSRLRALQDLCRPVEAMYLCPPLESANIPTRSSDEAGRVVIDRCRRRFDLLILGMDATVQGVATVWKVDSLLYLSESFTTSLNELHANAASLQRTEDRHAGSLLEHNSGIL